MQRRTQFSRTKLYIKSSQKGNIIEITVSSAYNIYSSGKYEVQ